MITMEVLGEIKRACVRDKISKRAVAKRTGLSRNTVRKWLQTPEEVKAPKYLRAKKFGKLAGLADELEQVLKTDAGRSKQEPRSSKPLFKQIKASGNVCGLPPHQLSLTPGLANRCFMHKKCACSTWKKLKLTNSPFETP